MDAQQHFRDEFNVQNEAEAKWLEGLLPFVREYVWPLMSGPGPRGQTADDGASQLSASVLKRIRGKMSGTRTLPLSYSRPVCVSELLAHQRLPCVSDLSRSTDQERAGTPAGRRAPPRAHLLLIGRLTHGREGEWTLTDASGSVACEVVSPSPLWMGRLVFLPHWHYVPHSAPGRAQPEVGGFTEVIGSPVLLCPGSVQGLAGDPLAVKEAAAFVHDRVPGRRLSVCGQVASVCPLLVISGTAFFFFTLSDDTRTLPVLVKNSGSLWWAQCMSVGESVRVTALRVCVLQPWGGKNVLCATEHSEMRKTHDQCRTPAPETLPSTESQPERRDRLKRSRVINYQGTVTEVVSGGAGLYVMDGKLGLCLAYQPDLKRKLRVGDSVVLHHVHLLHRPCPDSPAGTLCTCLRSTVRVTKFSAVLNSRSAPDRNCPDDGVLQRLLVERNPDVSRYLWTCHLCSRLRRSLLPSPSPQCTCVLSWTLMEVAFGPGQRRRRDIYAEMLDETHNCPLTLAAALPATLYVSDSEQHQYISLSELHKSLQEDCWADTSLRSLLPPGGGALTRAEMNAALAWSSKTLTSVSGLQPGDSPGRRPLMLVGVLELPSRASPHTLQLRDRAGAIACVVTETDREAAGGHRAAFDTAWIGCLVCILQFTMVMERFLQSNFPSYRHLDQHKFITHKHCRVYLQFSQKSIHILSPSGAMETHLRHKEAESGAEEKEATARKRRREDGDPEPSSSSGTATGCVSLVLRVEQKNGVTWQEDEEASFSVAAAAMGPVAIWGRDPENGQLKDFEGGSEKKVTVVCSGASARWFPLLQPGCFYRLVASGTSDGSALEGASGPRGSRDVTLRVRPDWAFHTLTRPLHLARGLRAAPLTVSEVLDGSGDVVSFQGSVSDRINLNDRTRDAGHVNVGVRLTVCDRSGRSLHVFLNFNRKTYPPGLLPGNTLLLSAFRRRVSRSGRVYCSNIAVSWVAVMRVRDESRSEEPPPAPVMHLARWTQDGCTVGRVKGHVVRFLFMQLWWKCFECGSVYTQSACSRRCLSSSAVFDCTAKLVLEDGTGEAHVHFAGALVRQLLALSSPQWEGLQRALKARGQIQVYPLGRSQACDDGLLDFLLACVHGVNELFLTCSIESRTKEGEARTQKKKKQTTDMDVNTLTNTDGQIHTEKEANTIDQCVAKVISSVVCFRGQKQLT
ncbi:CST complex subunit CTC1 [Syngnathoides biaculeatus]|uniref:CST complex subunit CTC1 n=1 Tax=Syngnathoides biaculeatus TaxID=300417 RepID=UPI002ADDC91F|nr:CST complex subunit CTC1 [Syngnathoides biaculeatus]